MDRFVEITNPAKVRSNTNLVVAGIPVNQSEWNKYRFYPNKIIVPVLPSGISDISLNEFRRRLPQNSIIGRATEQQMNSNFNVDEVMDSLNKMFGL